ncbi:MAG TPA: hypothetical protein DCX77_10395 [Acidimicrobiaceae bacterium]|nr:hypothetical protein [Acidimicrobiaceae bacterium]HAX06074.1 hypothetical protein [Acidimicrobiaceae bacterium]|tara:strand:- start:335 stop:598 length:264 start_codon:yes stop_codon:yes gene_type:complete
MRYLVIQMENLLLLALGFIAGWLVVTIISPRVVVASLPAWLVSAAVATALLALGGRLVFDGTFQAFGIGLMASSFSSATLLVYEVVR